MAHITSMEFLKELVGVLRLQGLPVQKIVLECEACDAPRIYIKCLVDAEIAKKLAEAIRRSNIDQEIHTIVTDNPIIVHDDLTVLSESK